MQFRITVQPSGRQFSAYDHESVLDAASRQGLNLPYGCRTGRCGSCKAVLREGTVNYPAGNKPDVLREEAAHMTLPCVCTAASDLVLEVNELDDLNTLPVRIMPVKLAQKNRLNHDVMQLLLKLPEQLRLQFQAGQYVNFVLENGKRRAFSLANAPHNDQYLELHVRLVDGGQFTHRLFDEVAEQAILRIEAPLGQFVLREKSERPMLMVGGGTGFAPLKSLIEHAFHVGIQRPITLYWGVRSSRDLYMVELIQSWAAEYPQFRQELVLSEPDADWHGRRGWIHEAVATDCPDLSGHDIYMAGPPVMIQSCLAAFKAQGAKPSNIYSDSFDFAPA